MITIRKIYKNDIAELLSDDQFWNHSFLAISKHRLTAHSKNPNLNHNDIVLLLAYQDDELVGYMGIFIDQITIDQVPQKIGWLSTWWVDPKTKGTGVGRLILDTMYSENEGRIAISQFTPSAKRVYDKSGYFTTLKENIGVKAVLRSNLSFVLPAFFPRIKSYKKFLDTVDHFVNFFVNIKLNLHKVSVRNHLKNVTLEYINTIDKDSSDIIKKYSTEDLSCKDKAYFDWLKAYPWVLPAPLLELTAKGKYEFSLYDKDFDFYMIKVLVNQSCIAFVVLQKRNYVTKVLFTYYDTNDAELVSNVIKLHGISQNTREIICYDQAICNSFKKSSVFLYKNRKLKQSIISKVFKKDNYNDPRVQFGDGDCAFA